MLDRKLKRHSGPTVGKMAVAGEPAKHLEYAHSNRGAPQDRRVADGLPLQAECRATWPPRSAHGPHRPAQKACCNDSYVSLDDDGSHDCRWTESSRSPQATATQFATQLSNLLFKVHPCRERPAARCVTNNNDGAELSGF